MKFPWQRGYKEEKEATALALKKAQDDLTVAALEKSKGEGEELSAIAILEKSLEDYKDLAPLAKSKEELEEEEKEKEKEAEEEKMEKARLEKEEEDRLEKARESGDELEEELVKASLEFGALRKSVEEVTEMTGEGMDLLAKGLGSNTDLLIKTAHAVVGLQKSINELMGLVGKMPAKTSGLHLDLEKSRQEDDGTRTSVDEARGILIKAITEDKLTLPLGLLSQLDTSKNVGIIPADLREKYGIKA